jgi:hypothetical protein
MASIITISGENYLNIDATVGKDGRNRFDDVYLVQAMLREVVTSEFNNFVLLQPTGIFSSNTKDWLETLPSTIRRKFGAKTYFKDHIDPIAVGIYAFGSGNKWAMVHLNNLLYTAIDRAVGRQELQPENANFVGFMCGKYPTLSTMLGISFESFASESIVNY